MCQIENALALRGAVYLERLTARGYRLAMRLFATAGLLFVLALSPAGSAHGQTGVAGAARLSGDWDYIRTLGGTPSGGFEARRHVGFAHFEGTDASRAWMRRRSGGRLATVRQIDLDGDSLVLTLGRGAAIRAAVRGDTISGRYLSDGVAVQRVRLVRRATPPAYEPPSTPWPGPLSEPTYEVAFDAAVPMTARDGTTLMSFVARPVGAGPFPVVMERTPYLRTDSSGGRWWASRGYLFVKQDLRGRGGSAGDADPNLHEVEDGYDAVEWAAALPGSSGRVGLVGGSNPGLSAWYAAIAAPPHLAAIAPSVATADPTRLLPYIDMVFSPTIVPWVCLTGVRETLTDMSNLDLVTAFATLPVSESVRRAGCPEPAYWNTWLDHPTRDAYWRALSVEGRLDRVRVPALGISGWYDDARGTLRNYVGVDTLAAHPPQRIVIGPGSHKGIDYVTGDFGPTARVDSRLLQLRWFDHYLKGDDNGVDREPPVDLFIMGPNVWRQEREWPLARTQYTPFYFHSGGNARTSAGDGTLSPTPPADEPADTYTYDPADPTPYLVDARELELSLNEDYAAVNAARTDALAFTSAPLAEALEITGPLSATIWAATDARDTDWNVMVLDVFPDGRALRIQDGVMRARFRDGFDRVSLPVPGEATRYDLDLWFTGLVLPAGHRIRVTVASAAFPKYDRNLNTGGDNERDAAFVVAHQRILHDAAHPSHVTLPVIPPARP